MFKYRGEEEEEVTKVEDTGSVSILKQYEEKQQYFVYSTNILSLNIFSLRRNLYVEYTIGK